MNGRDDISGLPKTVRIESEEIRRALNKPLDEMSKAVKDALDATPPDLASDLMYYGILLTGGGAMLRGLDVRLRDETGVAVNVSPTGLDNVVTDGRAYWRRMPSTAALSRATRKGVIVLPRSNKKRYTSTLNNRRQSSGMRPFVICCLVSLLLLTFYVREGEAGVIHSIRSGVNTVATPVRMVGAVVATPFNAIGNVFTNLSAPQETLSELKKQNEELTSELAQLTEAEKTAERLESLLGLQSTYNLQSTAARIIGTTGDAWSQTVTIDKGSANGFEIGMPVCNSGGVIGQIIEVSAATSTVRLINDENSGVSAMVQSTRAQGILQGQPDGTLMLSYVPADADVKVGDVIITSGLGGRFPKGLPLGTVSSVSRAANATYYTIVVRAISTAESNEEVLVITSLTDEQAASSEDVAAANTAAQGNGAASTQDASADSADASTDGSTKE